MVIEPLRLTAIQMFTAEQEKLFYMYTSTFNIYIWSNMAL